MGRNWAIAIGINKYENLLPLKHAKRDAVAMATWFKEEAKFDEVFLFTEDSPPISKANPPIPTEPTYCHLRRFLRAQFENIKKPLLKPEDNLWFFFAGHGRRNGDKDYLMLCDSDPGDAENTAISVEYVTQRLRRSGADNVIMFLDACRDKGSRSRGGFGIGTEEHQGVITFYSCTANQQSWEIDELQHGSFTHTLLEGLRLRGEANCATVERLDQYLSYYVPQLNANYRKPIQNPYLKAEPPYKMYFILLEQSANIKDVEPLKLQASLAENEGNLPLAEQLWIRVLAVSRADLDAIAAIKRIARRQTKNSAYPTQEPVIPIPEPATLSRGEEAGFGIIKYKSDTIVSVLEDVARLIGERRDGSITLCNGKIIDCPGLNLQLESQRLDKLANEIRKGIFKVIVLGDINAGKSTLINAMLGHEILPTSVVPATAIITIFAYGGNNEKIPKEVAVYKTGIKNPILLPWDDFIKEYQLTYKYRKTHNKKNFVDSFADIEYAQIECSYRLLEHGVQLIDSPSLNHTLDYDSLCIRFLEQSQAVIFLLNAGLMLNEWEIKFIEQQLGSGRLNHVFFVVNKIDLLEDEEDLEFVKEQFRDCFKHHFLDENGNFDEAFYNRRLFYINAKAALDARTAKPEDTNKLEASGVLDLEIELELFLRSDEKNIAALEAAFRVLESGLTLASQNISQAQEMLSKHIEEQKRILVRAGVALKSLETDLETDKREIETIIFQYEDMIQQGSKQSFSMQKEKERLDAIYYQLIDLYNMAGKALGKSSQELSSIPILLG